MNDRIAKEESYTPPVGTFPQRIRRDGDSWNTAGQATHESDRLYRSLFEHMLNGFAYCRMLYDHDQPCDFIYLDVNKAFENQTGLTNVVGKRVSEVIPGIRQSSPELFEIYGRVARTGKPEVFETFVEPLRMWFAISVYSPRKDHFVAVFDVITGRKTQQAREALARQVLTVLNGGDTRTEMVEGILGLIRKNTGLDAAAIRLLDGEDYPYYATSGFPPSFVEAERHLCMRGQTGEVVRDATGAPVLAGMCGRVIRGWFEPSQPFITERGSFWTNGMTHLFSCPTEQDLCTGACARCTGRGYESVALIPLRTADGVIGLLQLNDPRPGMFSAGMIQFLEDLGVSIGIALARRQAEEELRESEEKLQYVFDHLPVGMSITLPTGDVYANESFSRMLGYSREELRNRTWQQLTHPEDMALTQKMIDALLSGAEFSVRFVKRYLRRDGSILWADASTSLRRDNSGRPLYFMTAVSDITAQNRAEEEIRGVNESLEQRVHKRTAQLEAANRELEAFAYSVSHDLRAPLRAIDGYARILTTDYADRLGEEGRRLLGVVCGEAQRMGRLIDDLLAFSQMSRHAVQEVDVAMDELVQTVFDQCAAQDPGRQIRLELHPLPIAHGDPAMLRQALINLLDNAVKYTGPRETAQIEVGGRVEGGESLYYVKDNGVGFDMKYAHKLFGIFQRLHSEAEFEGTGVGLALVQRIIHRHGGRVWAEARLDEGAAFYFTLPLRKEEHGR